MVIVPFLNRDEAPAHLGRLPEMTAEHVFPEELLLIAGRYEALVELETQISKFIVEPVGRTPCDREVQCRWDDVGEHRELRGATSDVVEEQLLEIEPLLQRIFASADPHPAFRVARLLTKMSRGRGG